FSLAMLIFTQYVGVPNNSEYPRASLCCLVDAWSRPTGVGAKQVECGLSSEVNRDEVEKLTHINKPES
ncbi:MAG: hypothetical protein QW080_04900, partial [Sulfolobales archaeon]